MVIITAFEKSSEIRTRIVYLIKMGYERINPIGQEHQAVLNAIGTKVQSLRKTTGLSIERYCVKHDIARISYTNLQSGKNFHMTTLLKVLDAHPEIKSLSDFFDGIELKK